MAGLQTIVDNANSLLIDRRKVVGLQITRNEIPRVTVTPTRQPWKMTLEMPNSLRYYNNRDLLETIDNLDRVTPQTINFANNSCINWIFRYQGAMTSGQISTLTVASFPYTGTSNVLELSGLPTVASNTVLFKQNDLIQFGSYPYPYTVVGTYSGGITTYGDVLRGGSSTVLITLNRPKINSQNLTGLGLTVGSACNFYMFCPNMPTYKLIPGGYVPNTNTTALNNALIEFSDSFQFYEYVGTA